MGTAIAAPLTLAKDPYPAWATGEGDSTAKVSDFVGVNGNTTYEQAIQDAIEEANSNSPKVVDFEGVSYVTTGTVTISDDGVSLINGGIRADGIFPALRVQAKDVTVRDMKFSRSKSRAWHDSSPERCCVVVTGERFRSYDCEYLAANLACLLLTHGACAGSVISGGEMTGTADVQNGAGVMTEPGLTGNRDITISGVFIHDVVAAVLLFDTSHSVVENCRVERLRKLPTLELTGWNLVSGNVYRQRSASGVPGVNGVPSDREDAATVVVTVNGEKYSGVKIGSTTPPENSASIAGGYIYINLGGMDPNNAIIFSDCVSGYGITVYSTNSNSELCGWNRITANTVADCDGFGVYLQLGGTAEAKGNQVAGNVLTNVCMTGSQTPALPFAGIGVAAGSETLITGNRVDGVGSPNNAVPGVYINWAKGVAGTPSGQLVDTTVSRSYGFGFDIRSSNWTAHGCRAENNGNSGFTVKTTLMDGVVENIIFTDCTADSNGGEGFAVDGSVADIGYLTASIIGGAATGNGRRGIAFNSSPARTTTKNCSAIGVDISDNSSSKPTEYAQVLVNGMAQKTRVVECRISDESTGAKGVVVAQAASGTIVEGNDYSISYPEIFNGTS